MPVLLDPGLRTLAGFGLQSCSSGTPTFKALRCIGMYAKLGAAQFEQLRQSDRGISGDRYGNRQQPHRVADKTLAFAFEEGDMNNLLSGRTASCNDSRSRTDGPSGTPRLGTSSASTNVSGAQGLFPRCSEIERMGVGEHEAHGVNDRSDQYLSQFPERRERLWHPPDFSRRR